MNAKKCKKLRNISKEVCKSQSWPWESYVIDRVGAIVLVRECGKGVYRHMKKLSKKSK